MSHKPNVSHAKTMAVLREHRYLMEIAELEPEFVATLRSTERCSVCDVPLVRDQHEPTWHCPRCRFNRLMEDPAATQRRDEFFRHLDA